MQLIDEVASYQKPTIISTGLADLELLRSLVARWEQISSIKNLCFLHCVSSYPVPEHQVNLRAIHDLKAVFPDLTIGYSDHSLGIDAARLAVMAGAQIIEKHFTLDKNYSDSRDHQLSADCAEMSELVRDVRHMDAMLGEGLSKRPECESVAALAIRRSIVAARNIKRGDLIREEDLVCLRPGGYSPDEINQLLGKKALENIIEGGSIKVDVDS